MTDILSYFPGQLVTIFQEMLDQNGVRTDGYAPPMVTRIIFPAFTLASGLPQNMNRIDIGLYYFQFTLPTGAISIGSYLVDVAYLNPTTGYVNTNISEVIVTAPFGSYGVLAGA